MTRSGRREGIYLVLPALLFVLAIVGSALVSLVVYSLWTQDYLDIVREPTLANYRRFFTEPMFTYLLGKSLLIGLFAAILTVVVAYPVAYFVSFKAKGNKLVWIIVITLPFWMSYLLRVFAWRLILGYNGVLNSGLLALGIVDQPLEFILYNNFSVVLTLVHAWAPFAVIPIFLSMERIDRTLFQAAADLGDTPLQRFRRVTWPLTLPGVFSAGILVFIPTVGDYVTPQLVGGTDGTMVGNLMFAMFGRLNDWPLGSAMALLSLAAIGLTVFLASRLLGVRPARRS
jgi:spermidine/putrescine transport system permease protein